MGQRLGLTTTLSFELTGQINRGLWSMVDLSMFLLESIAFLMSDILYMPTSFEETAQCVLLACKQRHMKLVLDVC